MTVSTTFCTSSPKFCKQQHAPVVSGQSRRAWQTRPAYLYAFRVFAVLRVQITLRASAGIAVHDGHDAVALEVLRYNRRVSRLLSSTARSCGCCNGTSEFVPHNSTSVFLHCVKFFFFLFVSTREVRTYAEQRTRSYGTLS